LPDPVPPAMPMMSGFTGGRLPSADAHHIRADGW
jgi:hypothetical protein